MKPFRYCPACAARLQGPDDDGAYQCPECKREWYRPFAPTAGAAIVKDGRVLVTLRARDPEKGRFDVPGGFLRTGEDPIAGLKREIREELGIEIEVLVEDCLQMVPHLYGDDGDFVLSLGFMARMTSGDPMPRDDVAELRWLDLSELEQLDFAWEHDRELARKALAHGHG